MVCILRAVHVSALWGGVGVQPYACIREAFFFVCFLARRKEQRARKENPKLWPHGFHRHVGPTEASERREPQLL